MTMGSNFLITIISFLLFSISALTLAAEPDNDIDVLKSKYPALADLIIVETSVAFRDKYGERESRYTDKTKSAFNTKFLDLAKTFKLDSEEKIQTFLELSNKQMKLGLTRSESRYEEESEKKFSESYKTYLTQNLRLLKNGDELTSENANQLSLKNVSAKAALESIGGNAGQAAQAVNFLTDADGRILFVGNHQDAPPHMKDLFNAGKLYNHTIHSAVDPKIYRYLSNDKISEASRARIEKALTKFYGVLPQQSYDLFKMRCKIALEKLFAYKH